jgi:hypothetical protein
VAQFRRVSVDRFGGHWNRRFENVVSRAASVRITGASGEAASPLSIRLSGLVAMGNAVMQAETLTTEAVQLLILESGGRFEDLGLSGAIGSAWRKAGHRQEVVTAPRVRARARRKKPRRGGAERLAAVLRLARGSAGEVWATNELVRLKKVFSAAEGVIVPPLWTGEAVVAGFAEPLPAARAAIAAAAIFAGGIRIAGHYGIVHSERDPFAGRAFLAGPAAALPAAILLSTPAGAIHVSEDFAATLYATTGAKRPHSEHIGELPGPGEPLRLFSIRPR